MAEHQNDAVISFGEYDPERTPLGLIVRWSVFSPTRITPENNGEIRLHLDREKRSLRASGGGKGTAVEPSLGHKALILNDRHF